jgi:CheY-like chemotaxis protein
LGLSVAKQISNLHDGNIWVESEVGKGSTFSILLPHVVSRTELLDKKNRTRPVVLVAEPALPRRSEYFDQLEEWGYEVVYARDGVEAVGLLFHLLPNICILTGKLPKLDILDIVSIAKADILTSTIPLVLCGEDSEQLEQHVDTHKFDRFLKLPFTSESFSLLSESVGVLTTEIVDKKAA